jgi:hypothetical protein
MIRDPNTGSDVRGATNLRATYQQASHVPEFDYALVTFLFRLWTRTANLALGFVAALLIVARLVVGLLWRTRHQKKSQLAKITVFARAAGR